MKTGTTIDRLQDLAVDLSCTVDNLTVIQVALSEETVSPEILADAVFSVRNHIKHISDAMERILMEVNK